MDELPVIYAFTPNLAGLLSLVLMMAIPLGVGLVSTRITSAKTKALLLLLFMGLKVFIEAFIAALAAGVEFLPIPIIMNLVVNMVFAAGIHFGLWKPTGVADRALAMGRQAPSSGSQATGVGSA